MNKASLLVLLLLALAGAGGFLLWNGGDTAALPPVVALPEADHEVAAPIEALADAGLEAPKVADELPPEGLARIDVTVAESGDRDLVVQVWDRKEGVPAAAATVFVFDGPLGPEARDPFAQHWCDLAERHGLCYRTDPEGRVVLPPVRGRAIVSATSPGAFGFARVGPQHRDVETITLQADETVTVRVVDGDERPTADVPVGVVQLLPRREGRPEAAAQLRELEAQLTRFEAYLRDNPERRDAAMGKLQAARDQQARMTALRQQAKAAGGKAAAENTREGRPELRAQRRTDRDGLAVFRHFQVYRHDAEAWWPEGQRDRFEAVLMLPAQHQESRAFAGRPVPSDVIELHLPPCGSIALRTVDGDGRPFLHPVHAELMVQGGELSSWQRLPVRKPPGDAVIVYPFVGLDMQFTAQCRLDDNDFRWQAPAFAGPTHPGERVTIDLLVAPGDGMLSGRLLDGAGTPLAGARSTFLVSTLAGRLEGEEIVLDAAGRFHLPYKVRPQHQAPFRLEVRRDEVQPPAGLVMALATLPAAIVTDLGDLRLEALPLLAHGAVTDDRGAPIAGATLQLQRERDVGGDRPRREFVDEAFSLVRSDLDGRFEFHGDLASGRSRLRVQAAEHFPFDTADLALGTRLDVVLQRRSRVVGTVMMPEWMSSKAVRVRLESAVDPQSRREDQVRDHQGKKYLYFDWVKPGIYNLQLSLQGFPDPFLQVDGLQILPGQMTLHPRLTDLDLGAWLFRFEIEAVDELGQPVQVDRPLLARIARPDGRTSFVGIAWKGGRVEVISASPQLDVVPLAAGYAAAPAVLAQGRNQLLFRRIPPLDLQVPGLSECVGTTPVQLVMQWMTGAGLPDQLENWDEQSNRIQGWYARSRYAAVTLGGGDTARFVLQGSGHYRVFARLGAGKVARPVGLQLGEVDVQLVPGTGPQRVVMNFDPARLQRGLADLAQRQAVGGNGK